MTARTTILALAGSILLAPPACQTFDKEGGKPAVTLTTPAGPEAMRAAVVTVLGREGFTVVSQDGDPMVFSRPAGAADRIFHQDVGGNELITRACVWVASAAEGSEVELTAQILHRPGTMFEDAKYPLLGSNSYYRKLLARASRLAQGLPE